MKKAKKKPKPIRFDLTKVGIAGCLMRVQVDDLVKRIEALEAVSKRFQSSAEAAQAITGLHNYARDIAEVAKVRYEQQQAANKEADRVLDMLKRHRTETIQHMNHGEATLAEHEKRIAKLESVPKPRLRIDPPKKPAWWNPKRYIF